MRLILIKVFKILLLLIFVWTLFLQSGLLIIIWRHILECWFSFLLLLVWVKIELNEFLGSCVRFFNFGWNHFLGLLLDNSFVDGLDMNLHGLYRVAWVCLSFHLSKQERCVTAKISVFIDLDVFSFLLNFLKVVHIQLSDERGEFVVFEILWQNYVFKQHLICYLKAGPILCPADNIIALFIANYLIYFADKLWNAMMYLQLFVVLNILKWVLNLLEINISLKRQINKWMVSICTNILLWLFLVLFK